jgi:hypothetical protein
MKGRGTKLTAAQVSYCVALCKEGDCVCKTARGSALRQEGE